MTNCEATSIEETVGLGDLIKGLVFQLLHRVLVEDVVNVERVLDELLARVVEPFWPGAISMKTFFANTDAVSDFPNMATYLGTKVLVLPDLGDFLKFLATNLLTKVAQKDGWIWAILKENN